jgi:hypothetical protein
MCLALGMFLQSSFSGLSKGNARLLTTILKGLGTDPRSRTRSIKSLALAAARADRGALPS